MSGSAKHDFRLGGTAVWPIRAVRLKPRRIPHAFRSPRPPHLTWAVYLNRLLRLNAAPAAPDLGRLPEPAASLEPAAVPDLGRSAEPLATPRYPDVMFDYCGVLIDRRARRTIEGLYPAGVVDMFFDPADPHGVAFYDDLADLGWSEERIIADYEREHGPAVAWIMRLYFEFQRLSARRGVLRRPRRPGLE